MKKKIITKKAVSRMPVKRKQPAKPKTTSGPARATTPAEDQKISKKEMVIALLRRENGATLAELMTATGWQAHSVRGFISGTLRKKHGCNIESTKDENVRSYKLNR